MKFSFGVAGYEYAFDFSRSAVCQKHSIASIGEPARVIDHPLQDNPGLQTF